MADLPPLSAHARSQPPWRVPALRGVSAALGLPALTIAFSLVGIGGLARDIGYPVWAGALSSALIWAGPAQVLLFGGIAAGTSLPVLAIAIFFSSIRFMPMVMSLVPLINAPRRPMWQLLAAAHLVAITNWAEGMRRLPHLPPAERYPYFMGFGLVVMASGTLATALGYYLIGALPLVLAAALLFTTPMFFTANLVATAQRLTDWLPLILAPVLVAVGLQWGGSDYDIMIAGIVAGSTAYIVHRTKRIRP
jgi:predicted branched-subunit amino acid permease